MAYHHVKLRDWLIDDIVYAYTYNDVEHGKLYAFMIFSFHNPSPRTFPLVANVRK